MSVTEQDIFDIIETHCGISIKNAQQTTMSSYLNRHLEKLHMTLDEYYTFLNSSSVELSSLIDEAAINETYFFREEQQFDYLTKVFFPQFKTNANHISIWSAACSTGEEPISLYLAAKCCGLQVTVYASDIDTVVLSSIKEGLFRIKSFRSDGKKYLPLLEAHGSWEKRKFKLYPDVQNSIHYFTYNLMNLLINNNPPLPADGVDLIFLRNLFIYFEPDLRNRLLRHIATFLKPNALLFLSINEIASIDCDDSLPFVKEHVGTVYFLRKINNTEKKASSTSILKPVKRDYKPVILPQSQTKSHVLITRQQKVDKKEENTQIQQIDTIPQLYAKIQNDITYKNYPHALTLIQAYPFRVENTEFKYYFLGLVKKAQGNITTAYELFQKATYTVPLFWPGYFQQLTLTPSLLSPKEKEKLISTCKNYLKQYIQNQETCYNFIMEQFSPEYFLTLCDSLDKK